MLSTGAKFGQTFGARIVATIATKEVDDRRGWSGQSQNN
jgi:hypothetical protein